MTGLTTIFKGDTEPAAQDDGKLLDLFRNRVELKKEFAALRKEQYRLQDRLKEEQGASARVQQKLDHLENLLLDPEWVHNVAVFFQLKRIGIRCRSKLERFAEQLKQQREQRLHGKVLDAWNAERLEDIERAQTRLDKHRHALQLLEDRLQSERHNLATMNGVTRLLRRKEFEAGIAGIEAEIEAGRARDRVLSAELERIQNLTPPDPEGLDIQAKRSVNYMILSFCQHLYLHYADDDLASLIRGASEKSVGAVNYGDKAACDEVLALVEARGDNIESAEDFAGVIRQRANLIADRAMFRGDDDTVPVSASVSTVFDIDGNGRIRKLDVNLLGENYFGVSKVLSR